MTRPTHIIKNCTTGEETIIEYTDEEIVQLEERRAQAEAMRAEREAQAQVLAALKESAKAKLVAGKPLTEEEASVLVI